MQNSYRYGLDHLNVVLLLHDIDVFDIKQIGLYMFMWFILFITWLDENCTVPSLGVTYLWVFVRVEWFLFLSTLCSYSI